MGLDLLDERAEREGTAELWMSANLGTPYDTQPNVRFGFQVEEARELGIKPRPVPQYRRLSSVLAHVRMIDCYRQGKRYRVEGLQLSESSRLARQPAVQAANRNRFQRQLDALLDMPDDRRLSISAAAQLIGVHHATILRDIAAGRLQCEAALPTDRTSKFQKALACVVTVAALRQMISAKLSGAFRLGKWSCGPAEAIPA